MHPELDRIDGDLPDELRQRGLGVGRQVIRRNTPYQTGGRMIGRLFIAGYAAALHPAAVDMIPDTGRKTDSALMRHGYQSPDGRQVALLLFRAQTHHAKIRITVDIEKIGIARRQKTAVLVPENDDQ